jgi:hypothetical protein
MEALPLGPVYGHSKEYEGRRISVLRPDARTGCLNQSTIALLPLEIEAATRSAYLASVY